MAYVCELSRGRSLYLDNAQGQTTIAIANTAPGQQQQATSRFQTGDWTAIPEVYMTQDGAVIKLQTNQGAHYIRVHGNSIGVSEAFSLSHTGTLNMQQMSVAPAMPTPPPAMPPMDPLPPMAPMEPMAPMAPMEPMAPMAPMPPMTMGDMQMNMNPMQMRMGNMQMQMGKAAPAIAQPQNQGQRFCSQCGNAVKPDDRFCTHCGHRLGD